MVQWLLLFFSCKRKTHRDAPAPEQQHPISEEEEKSEAAEGCRPPHDAGSVSARRLRCPASSPRGSLPHPPRAPGDTPLMRKEKDPMLRPDSHSTTTISFCLTSMGRNRFLQTPTGLFGGDEWSLTGGGSPLPPPVLRHLYTDGSTLPALPTVRGNPHGCARPLPVPTGTARVLVRHG